MGLKYTDLYSKTEKSDVIRNNLYKENTNVLAYYVIKAILINNYQDFLFWCKNNNISLLQFKKTPANQMEFCKFIEKKYKTGQMLKNVKSTELFMKNLQHVNNTHGKDVNNIDYLMTNMRMTMCELG